MLVSRFAIGCGLHRKRPDNTLDSIHLPPEEEIQADDPMTLWYAMYHTDALISAGGSLPTSVPEKVHLNFLSNRGSCILTTLGWGWVVCHFFRRTVPPSNDQGTYNRRE
jgi:hypothetical protein